MKCPKCNYIGFEPSDRCRNCGYDFSLSGTPTPEPDLPMRSADPAGPLADLELGDGRPQPRPTPQARAARRRQGSAFTPGSPSPAADLPLFGEIARDDSPLVLPSSAPPLSVRRSTPAPTRTRASVIPRPLERQPDVALPLETEAFVPPVLTRAAAAEPLPPPEGIATLGPRCAAAAIDWAMLLGLDLAIVYFTLRVSRLGTAEIVVLPLAPLIAFLLLLNGGYLVLFTAARGQTIGKMAFGLKVVSGSDQPLTAGRAVARELAFILGAVAAGLGLVPAAFDGARRCLHDRLADTRVVRAPAS